MIEKIKKYYREGTLFLSIKNKILKITGFFLLKRIVKWVKKEKLARYIIPKETNNIAFLQFFGPCVVFGSAPSPKIPKDYSDNWYLITAGSAQYSTDKLGLKKPDLSLLATSTFLNDGTDWYFQYEQGTLKAIEGKFTKFLLMVEYKFYKENERFSKKKMILNAIAKNNIKYNNTEFISYALRFKLSGDILKDPYFYRASPSTGLFVAILAYHHGAKPLILTGFSFSHHKHAYPDDFFNKPSGRGDQGRGELEADKRAIKIILDNEWEIYAADEKFSEESGLPLWFGLMN